MSSKVPSTSLQFHPHAEPSNIFTLQSAYEIATYWGEDPPPKEILEELSAKGGDLRTRTLANHSTSNAPTSIEVSMAEGGGEPQEEEQVTPKKEKMESEEPGSASRYPTRKSRAA